MSELIFMTNRLKIKRLFLIIILILIPFFNPAESSSGSLSVVRVGGKDYLSFVEIARSLNIGFSFDMNLQRGRLYHKDRLAVFSVGFPVAISNGILLKSDYETIRHNGMVLIPLETALLTIESFFSGISFEEKEQEILFSLTEAPPDSYDYVPSADPVPRHDKITFIVIDPGHGGKDPGAIGLNSLKEKDLVLDFSMALKAELEKKLKDVRIIMTRKDDRFLELAERTDIANKHLKKGENGIFLSIHFNASVSPKVSGFETYFLSQNPSNEAARRTAALENDVIVLEERNTKSDYKDIDYIEALMMTTQIQRESSKLAESIQGAVENNIKALKSNGVKKADFFVLRGVLMPAVLIEAGYITHAKDADFVKNRKNHSKIAKSIVDGIEEFIVEFEKGIFP